MRQYPHCDSGILHSPEANCKYCNESGLQEIREAWNINFTGEHDPKKTICPAEQKRPVDTINKWGGNRPATPEALAEMDKMYDSLKRESVRVQTSDSGQRSVDIRELIRSEMRKQLQSGGVIRDIIRSEVDKIR